MSKTKRLWSKSEILLNLIKIKFDNVSDLVEHYRMIEQNGLYEEMIEKYISSPTTKNDLKLTSSFLFNMNAVFILLLFDKIFNPLIDACKAHEVRYSIDVTISYTDINDLVKLFEQYTHRYKHYCDSRLSGKVTRDLVRYFLVKNDIPYISHKVGISKTVLDILKKGTQIR